tara:strand:+ start:138 stop:503 length:366 start_codon:yes stop_codon:yes gene_type:complete
MAKKAFGGRVNKRTAKRVGLAANITLATSGFAPIAAAAQGAYMFQKQIKRNASGIGQAALIGGLLYAAPEITGPVIGGAAAKKAIYGSTRGDPDNPMARAMFERKQQKKLRKGKYVQYVLA